MTSFLEIILFRLLVDVLVRDVETVMAYEPKVTAKRVLVAMTQYLRPVT